MIISARRNRMRSWEGLRVPPAPNVAGSRLVALYSVETPLAHTCDCNRLQNHTPPFDACFGQLSLTCGCWSCQAFLGTRRSQTTCWLQSDQSQPHLHTPVRLNGYLSIPPAYNPSGVHARSHDSERASSTNTKLAEQYNGRP